MPESASSPTAQVLLRNVPVGPVTCDLRVATHELDLQRLSHKRFMREEIRHAFVGEERFHPRPREWSSFRKNLTVIAENPAPRRLLGMIDELRRLATDYLFTPASIGDGTMAIMAASLDVPVRLAFSEDWPEDVLNEILDYFLHSPTLSAPIEPFYTLAGAVAGQSEATFWDIFGERLGRHWYIDDERRVTLSPRWAEQGRFFGSADDSDAALRESALWTELSGLRDAMFIQQKPCAFCAHFPCCAGFWTTTTRAGETCAMWQRIMDRLAAAYREQAADSTGAGAQPCRTSS